MKKPKKSFTEQVEKEYPDFVAVVAGLSVEDLDKRLSDYAKEQENALKAQEEDTELESTKEKLKELKAPYNDVKKALRLKMRYLIKLIEEKGGQT